MKKDSIVICAARRTPIGSFLGNLSTLSAPQLGCVPVQAVLKDTGFNPQQVDSLMMGCVLTAGQGQAPARQAGLAAGVPVTTACTTVNKMCGSGLETICLAHDRLVAGRCGWILAGGMESMSNAPYLLQKARGGYRMGHGELLDHMMLDGLEDAYEGKAMGLYAEQAAAEFAVSREQQDEFAAESVRRAQEAVKQNRFQQEIVPVQVTNRKGTSNIAEDEPPSRCDIGKIPQLKPAFLKDSGTVTAATSSSIADGAAAVLMTTESNAVAAQLPILVRICGYASYAGKPSRFTSAPIHAIDKLQRELAWRPSEVDLYEVNEAFAVVAVIAMRELKLSREQLNVNGGAVALGHPIGASGARIVTTLIHALMARNLTRGIACLCIGGGEALAIAFQRAR